MDINASQLLLSVQKNARIKKDMKNRIKKFDLVIQFQVARKLSQLWGKFWIFVLREDNQSGIANS